MNTISDIFRWFLGQPAVRNELTHYSVVPFVAVCGADAPNQKTSQVFERCTCDACMDRVENALDYIDICRRNAN
jgi:hypothetical protein